MNNSTSAGENNTSSELVIENNTNSELVIENNTSSSLVIEIPLIGEPIVVSFLDPPVSPTPLPAEFYIDQEQYCGSDFYELLRSD